jgi:hypothetical protein
MLGHGAQMPRGEAWRTYSEGLGFVSSKMSSSAIDKHLGMLLQQLDWCIGYMCGSGRVAIARSLSKNRAYIRTHLLKRAEQPLPPEQPGPTQKTEVS